MQKIVQQKLMYLVQNLYQINQLIFYPFLLAFWDGEGIILCLIHFYI